MTCLRYLRNLVLRIFVKGRKYEEYEDEESVIKHIY